MWRSSSVVWAFLPVLLTLAGCSLSYDFSRFHVAEGDAGGRDAGTGPDVGTPDAAIDAAGPSDASMDAATGPDAFLGEDAATPDDAASVDAATPHDVGNDASRDGGPVPSCQTGLGTPTIVDLGPITNLRIPLSNTRFAVAGAASGDFAVAYVDDSGNLRFHSFRLTAGSTTATTVVSERTLGTGYGVTGTDIDLARHGTEWIVEAYSPLGLYRCTDTTCSPLTPPTGTSSTYAVAAHDADLVLLHAHFMGTSFVWQATPLLPGTATTLATGTNSPIQVDVAARESDLYVAVLDEDQGGSVHTSLAWFAASGGSVQVTRSALTDPSGAAYVTYDAMSGYAFTLTTSGPMMQLHRAASTDVMTEQVGTWAGRPEPLYSRGDGTIFLAGPAAYELRASASPGTAIAHEVVRGDFDQLALVLDSYAHFAAYDEATDRMELRIFPCR